MRVENSLFEGRNTNMKKRFLCLLLALTTTVSLCACQGKDEGVDTAATEAATTATETEELSYDEESASIYDAALGEFYAAYQAAEAEENVSKRYALMAVAEAKLMETAVMLPFHLIQ